MTRSALLADLRRTHAQLTARDLLGPEQAVQSLPTPTLHVAGNEVVSFCSNNYLGLNHRTEVKQAAAAALSRYTHATSESRRLGGNLNILEDLEGNLAEFKGAEHAMLTATGLLANVAAVHGLLDIPRLATQWYGTDHRSDLPVVIYDEQAHRSIVMGAQIARAERVRFRHNDVDHLAQLLTEHKGRAVLVVTEGVFSMDGDLADLPNIADACDEFGALLMVDDAHGTGVYGTRGTGVVEHFGLHGRVPIQVVTLSKALGGMGGAILSDLDTGTLLRTFASGYRFTSSLPAEQAAATDAALAILRTEPAVRETLWANVTHLRNGLGSLGITAPGNGPIVPLVVGSPGRTASLERQLMKRGFLCPAVTPPAVPPDGCRVRLTVTAMHQLHHIDGLLNALSELRADQLGSAVETSTPARELRRRSPAPSAS